MAAEVSSWPAIVMRQLNPAEAQDTIGAETLRRGNQNPTVRSYSITAIRGEMGDRGLGGICHGLPYYARGEIKEGRKGSWEDLIPL